MKLILLIMLTMYLSGSFAQEVKPLTIGIAGLTHSHVHWILGRAHDGDFKIVGIAEANRDLAERFLKQYDLPMSLHFKTLEEMLTKTNPEAVAAFNSIDEHLRVVELCAPRKIHVMVEKPLAVSLDHAKKMEDLAKKHKIHLLTNYETTWYGSNMEAIGELKALGKITKIVAHHGHKGPKEIGVNSEFLEWLTDPLKNGGGAMTDFGCYGANLMTWLLKGERPLYVVAVTRQMKPAIYPNVDDDATIIVGYATVQGIIQASWNWPYNRKDIEIYAERGYAFADRDGLKSRTSYDGPEQYRKSKPLAKPFHDPFVYFSSVIRNEIVVHPHDLSALENNLIVMEILEAAKKSASEGKAVYLRK